MHFIPLQKKNDYTAQLPTQLGPSNVYHRFSSFEVTRVVASVAMAYHAPEFCIPVLILKGQIFSNKIFSQIN